jgi:hypothetical protein
MRAFKNLPNIKPGILPSVSAAIGTIYGTVKASSPHDTPEKIAYEALCNAAYFSTGFIAIEASLTVARIGVTKLCDSAIKHGLLTPTTGKWTYVQEQAMERLSDGPLLR